MSHRGTCSSSSRRVDESYPVDLTSQATLHLGQLVEAGGSQVHAYEGALAHFQRGLVATGVSKLKLRRCQGHTRENRIWGSNLIATPFFC